MGGLTARISNFLFPRYCAECGRRLDIDESPICLKCNMTLPRLNHFASPYENELAQSFYGKARIEKVAAFMDFIPHSMASEITYSAKYYGNGEVAEEMGKLIGQEAVKAGFLSDIDAIVPVPVSARRTLERGYNQSAKLAQGIGTVSGIPVLSYVVVRSKFEKSQTRLTHFERQENVREAFTLVDADAVRGKHILIVDDVITTGATIISCAQEILKVPGCMVSILALGKTHSRL